MKLDQLDSPEHQRALEKQARENNYGVLWVGEEEWINCAEVQFTIGHGDVWENDYEEFSGHFRIFMPGDVDPWVCASETAEAEIEKRWPDATYSMVDDILAV